MGCPTDDHEPTFISPSPSTHHLPNYERILKMVKVTVNGKTVAESDETIVVENNHYFPPSSVNKSFITDSKTRYDSYPACSGAHLTLLAFRIHSTVCPWKGSACQCNPTTVRKANRDVPLSGLLRTMTPPLTANPFKTSPGIILSPKKKQTTSRTTLHSTRWCCPPSPFLNCLMTLDQLQPLTPLSW